jgi:hypothetical protein
VSGVNALDAGAMASGTNSMNPNVAEANHLSQARLSPRFLFVSKLSDTSVFCIFILKALSKHVLLDDIHSPVPYLKALLVRQRKEEGDDDDAVVISKHLPSRTAANESNEGVRRNDTPKGNKQRR